MNKLLQRLRSYFSASIWDEDLSQLPIWRAAPLRLIRDGALAVRGFREHELGIRSAALTYITVLSLVPMLAFAFSVAKGFGLYDRLIDDVVVEFLDTYFGEEAPGEPAPAPDGAELAGLEGLRVGPDDPSLQPVGASEESEAQPAAATEPSDNPQNPGPAGAAELVEGDPDGDLDGDPEGDPEGNPERAAGASEGATDDVEAAAGQLGAAQLEAAETAAQPSQVRAAINQVLSFVENTDVASLGAFGLFVLFAAVLRLLGQVENALNQIWDIAKPRHFLRKLTDYLAIVVVAPILALTATAVKASSNSSGLMDRLRDTAGVGGLVDALFALAPMFVMWLVFTLLYLVMPNTRVRTFSAILGGFVAALVWSGVQELYVKSQVGVSSYNQLYAGFAAIPLFLLWAYLSWISVLIGAEFAHADQSQAAFRRTAITRNSSAAFFEAAILSAVGRVAERFEYGGEPIPLIQLVDAVEIPEHTLRHGFERLVDAGLLVEAQESAGLCYVLGRAADRIRVFDVLGALRGSYPQEFAAGEAALDQRVAEAARQLETAQAESGANRTLRELVTEGVPQVGTADPGPAPENVV